MSLETKPAHDFEALRALRAIRHRDEWSHCPNCTATAKRSRADDFDWECPDCGHLWDGQYDHYDHEPELNPDR